MGTEEHSQEADEDGGLSISLGAAETFSEAEKTSGASEGPEDPNGTIFWGEVMEHLTGSPCPVL